MAISNIIQPIVESKWSEFMYQCTQCRAPVSGPNQLCDACQMSSDHDQARGEFEDLDTILNIRGPQDLERKAKPASSLLPPDHTPEVVGVVFDYHEMTELNDLTTPGAPSTATPLQLSNHPSEDMVFDQTSSEMNVGDLQLDELQNTIGTPPEALRGFGDSAFEDISSPAHTEISDIPSQITQQTSAENQEEIFEIKTTPNVSSGTPSLGPSALATSTSPSTVMTSSAGLPASIISAPQVSSSESELNSGPSSAPSTSSSPPPIPPPSPSLGGWMKVPNPFATSQTTQGVAERNDPQNARYYLLDLTSRAETRLIMPKVPLSIFESRVTWTLKTGGAYQLKAESSGLPRVRLQAWRPLTSSSGGQSAQIALQINQIYRCGAWVFKVISTDWRELVALRSPSDSGSPLTSKKLSLSLALYRDVTQQESPSGQLARGLPHVYETLGELLLQPVGLFPINPESTHRVGYGDVCEIPLPRRAIEGDQSSVKFSLRCDSDLSEVTLTMLSPVWRALSPEEEIPFGAVVSLEDRVFSLISIT